MNKRLMCAPILASLLVFNASYTVLAAPVSVNNVVTGRTEQSRQTGAIIPTAIQAPIYHNVTSEITLTGTVIIDGPQLVFTVSYLNGGLIPDSNITVTKIADKTYAYSAKVNPSAFKGDVRFALNAKTIYQNGKTAGQTHTLAPEQIQSIHVAYVAGFEHSDIKWGTYDRNQNQYTYSYDLIKVWDNGTKVSEEVTGTVSGTEPLLITGDDMTYDGEVYTDTVATPVNILSFATENLEWTYNTSSNKYDLSFALIKNLSNGKNAKETITKEGIDPSTVYTYTANDVISPDYSQDFFFTAPSAPVTAPAVSEAKVISSSIRSQWTGNDGNGGNVQEYYILTYEINGKSVHVPLEFTFNKGTDYVDQNLTYTVSINGKEVILNYTLPYVEPASKDVNTTSN